MSEERFVIASFVLLEALDKSVRPVLMAGNASSVNEPSESETSLELC